MALTGAGDGDCVIDVVKSNAVPAAMATGLEMNAAAFALLNRCVRDGAGQAGIIKGVGEFYCGVDRI